MVLGKCLVVSSDVGFVLRCANFVLFVFPARCVHSWAWYKPFVCSTYVVYGPCAVPRPHDAPHCMYAVQTRLETVFIALTHEVRALF